jgi:hypothetical protein
MTVSNETASHDDMMWTHSWHYFDNTSVTKEEMTERDDHNDDGE